MLPLVARRCKSVFRSRYAALASPFEDNLDLLSMALGSESPYPMRLPPQNLAGHHGGFCSFGGVSSLLENFQW